MITISKIFDPEMWQEGIAEKAKQTNRFILSGVAVNNMELDTLATGPGRIVEVPFWKSIDANDEPDYVNDVDTDVSTPSDVSQGVQVARKAFLHKSWGIMSLAKEVQGLSDPVGYIVNNIGGYWGSVAEKRTIASCVGVLSDSVTNHSSDMVVNIATDDDTTITDAELISPEAIINAKLTLGDRMNDVTAIALHSVVYARLLKLQLIEFKIDPATGVNLPYYLNMQVVVDDDLPVDAGTNRLIYTTVLFAPGSFGMGYGSPDYPLEIERKASVGNGGGADILHSRETYIIAPRGYEFTSSSVSGMTPSLAELKNAANWNRVYDYRKNIPVAFLKTNG